MLGWARTQGAENADVYAVLQQQSSSSISYVSVGDTEIASIRPPSKHSRCRIHTAPRDATAGCGFGQDHNQSINAPLGDGWVRDLGPEYSPATLVPSDISYCYWGPSDS